MMDYKFALVNSGYLKKTGTKNEYRANCPYCGESNGKFYMMIDLDSDASVRYHCFKCPARGNQVTEDLLRRFGIYDVIIPRGAKIMKSLLLDSGMRVSENIPVMIINESEDDINGICKELKSKISIDQIININDLISFQYIGNPYMFAKDYLGEWKIDMLKGRDYWFKLSNGNMVCYENDSWLEYISKRVKSYGIYQMKTLIDLTQTVNVLIGGDIYDMIGLYFNYENELITNRMYIGCMDKPYSYGLWHMIGKGIFGKSIHIHIFIKDNENINDIFIRNDLCKLFGKISIYKNITGKGYRCNKNDLQIRKVGKK